jgi:hypothetical protein
MSVVLEKPICCACRRIAATNWWTANGGETYVLDFRSTDGSIRAISGSVSGSDARFRCFPDDPDKVRLLVFIRKERLVCRRIGGGGAFAEKYQLRYRRVAG